MRGEENRDRSRANENTERERERERKGERERERESRSACRSERLLSRDFLLNVCANKIVRHWHPNDETVENRMEI